MHHSPTHIRRHNCPSVCPSNMMKPTLVEVLQSDSVKRLFNQPNLVIKTIPLKSLAKSSDKDTFWHKKNGVNTMSNMRPSELSMLSAMITDEEEEDANLLPSKIENEKSEIVLLPIKMKPCGHYEPCESIVCDVTLQQYVDEDGVSPMLALSIEEDEINAPVEKHCENEYCDALSIDHNRCRRALIKLYKCDRSYVCDICEITLKKWRSRIYHRNCKRKKEYVHNNVNRLNLRKERMRMRELQILEIAKLKKHNYSDPAKTMEILRKNEELIIIPQKVSSQPIVTMTSASNTQLISPTLTNVQSTKINSQITKVTNIPGSVPLKVSSQSTVISGSKPPLESKAKSIGQIRFPKNLQQNFHPRPTSIPILAPVQAQPKILTPAPPPTSLRTLTLALASASTSSSASTPISAPASVPTLALALARTSASSSSSVSTSTSNSVLTLTLAPTPARVPALIPISAPAPVTTSAPVSVVSSHKQYIRINDKQYIRLATPQTTTQTTAQPITINNLAVSPSHILTANSPTPIRPKTLIRVVPITNLISPPSLLHCTQGVPKFCIVAENLIKQVTLPKLLPSVQPANTVANIAPVQVNASNLPIRNPIVKGRKPLKLKKAKKNFFCNYCSKNITTDWYFKMHVAKHKGEKLFFCNFCDESFSNNYDMKKHVTNQHIGQEFACDKCNYTCTSLASFKSHVQTHAICTLNKADVQSKKQRKLKISEDKISHKLIRNVHKRKVKRIRYDDTSDSPNGRVEKRNNKELLKKINMGNKKRKPLNFVSVEEIDPENFEPENFEQESVITSR